MGFETILAVPKHNLLLITASGGQLRYNRVKKWSSQLIVQQWSWLNSITTKSNLDNTVYTCQYCVCALTSISYTAYTVRMTQNILILQNTTDTNKGCCFMGTRSTFELYSILFEQNEEWLKIKIGRDHIRHSIVTVHTSCFTPFTYLKISKMADLF